MTPRVKHSALTIAPNPEDRARVRSLYESFAVQFTELEDLPGALAYLEVESPDAIVCDWQLGAFTAGALLGVLRATPRLKDTPVLICADPTDDARRAAGRNHLVIRRQADSQALLDQALRLMGFLHPDGNESLEPMLFGLVLLADDSSVNQKIEGKILERAGAEIDVVSDGLEAVAQARARPYDLLVLDVEMPGLDGFQVVDQLRRAGATVPAIAVTGRDNDVALRQRAMDAGFNTVLTKPVDRRQLVRRCARFLRATRRARG